MSTTVALARLRDHISSNRLGPHFVAGSLSTRTSAFMIAKVLGADSSAAAARKSIMITIKEVLTAGGYDTNVVPVPLLHKILNLLCNTHFTEADITALQRTFQVPAASAELQLVPAGIVDASPLVSVGEPFELVPADALPTLGELQHMYRTMSCDEFCSMVAQLHVQKSESTARVVELEKERSSLLRSRAHYKHRCTQLVAQNQEVKDQLTALEGRVNFRPGKRNISLYGGYLLALKRNTGHTSAKALVSIVAGDQLNGAFKDPHLCIKYEHRACAAMRLMSKNTYSAYKAELDKPFDQSLDDKRLLVSTRRAATSLMFVQYVGDASNVDAVQKEKVHVGQVATMLVPVEKLLQEQDLPNARFKCTRSLCDLQRVQRGTGEEFVEMVAREMSSVGCPTWADAKRDSRADGHAVIYLFGLDKGPDNQGGTRHIKDELRNSPLVMMHAQWCILHQFHIIVEAVYKALDNFQWTDAAGDYGASGTTYFGGLKIVSNTWRSSSMPAKIYKAALAVTQDPVLANKLFLKIIGRCLRGRWGSGHSVEGTVDQCRKFIGEVFEAVFAKDPQHKAPAKAGEDKEASDYRELLGRWRSLTRTLTKHVYWKAAVAISHLAKGPLMEGLHWIYKRNKEVNLYKKASDTSGFAYIGKTALSDLVAFKAEEVRKSIAELLVHPGDRFREVLLSLPSSAHSDAHALLTTLVGVILGGWEQRVMEPVRSFPLAFLLMLEKPPGTPCDRRAETAQKFLDQPECCLQSRHSDISLKAKRLYHADFAYAKDFKVLTPELWGFLIGLRAMMVTDTQFIEGLNNVIQLMCRLAPNMHIGLVNSRLTIKQNPPVFAQDLVDMHGAVVQYVGSADHLERHIPVAIPPAFVHRAFRLCKHKLMEELVDVVHVAKPAGTLIQLGAQYVYGVSFTRPATLRTMRGVFFIASSKHYSDVRCLAGVVSTEDGIGTTFNLQVPASDEQLIHILSREAAQRPAAIRVLYVTRYPLIWTSRTCARVDLVTKPERTQILVKRPQAAKRPREDDVEGAVLEVEPLERVDLEHELGQLLEQDMMDDIEGDPRPEAGDEGDSGDEVEDEPAEEAAQEGHDGRAEHGDGRPTVITGEDKETFLREVERFIKQNREAMEEAHAQRRKPEHTGAIMDKGISLIQLRHHTDEGYEDSVEFVRWVDVSKRHARAVYIDEEDRVKYFVPGPIRLVDHEEMASAKVIVSNCPLQVWRLVRFKCPEWLMHIRRQAKARIYAGPLENAQFQHGACVVCSTSIERSRKPEADEMIYMCSECMSPIHMECSYYMYDVLGEPVPIFTEKWVCPMCHRDKYTAQ